MKTITLTQGHSAIVDDEDFGRLSAHKWYALNGKKARPYAVRSDTTRKIGVIFMHREILGLPKGSPQQGDHKNHNTLDNRRTNLREATPSQNSNNRRRVSKLGLKGVWLENPSLPKPYRAAIRHEGRTRHLGYFRDAMSAARAYDAVAAEVHGDNATLNFPRTS